MAQANAPRQAAYRAHHLKDENGTGERLQVLVDAPTKRALERLAVRSGVTQREILQKRIADTECAVLATLSRDEQDDYYKPRPKTVTP